jgi:hypothetical protein
MTIQSISRRYTRWGPHVKRSSRIYSKYIEPRNKLLAKEKNKPDYLDPITSDFSEGLWEARWSRRMTKIEIEEEIKSRVE